MSEELNPCDHAKIQRWLFSDADRAGYYADLWSCVECGRRFEPVANKRTPEPKE